MHNLGHFVAGEKVGHFVVLGQFVGRKTPMKQWFFISASVGHFVAGEEMGHFVGGTICRMGRKWDVLSSGTICLPKNDGGTICCWDKMSPNHDNSQSSLWLMKQNFFKNLTRWRFLQSKATGLHAPQVHDCPSYPLHKCSHLGVDVEYIFLMEKGE